MRCGQQSGEFQEDECHVWALMGSVITSANFRVIPGLRRGLSPDCAEDFRIGPERVIRQWRSLRPKGEDSGFAYG